MNKIVILTLIFIIFIILIRQNIEFFFVEKSKNEYIEQDILELVSDTSNHEVLGKEGPIGLKGKKGPKGYKGQEGLPGLPGNSGLPGIKGKTGLVGDMGPRGKRGRIRTKGFNGYTGNKGKRGSNNTSACISRNCINKGFIDRLVFDYGSKTVIMGNTPFKPYNNQHLGTINITKDYALSFDIYPLSKINNWSDILHFTSFHNMGEYIHGDIRRSPAIYFYPNTTKLHVVVGNTKDSNWHSCDVNLEIPIKKWSNFKLIVKNNIVEIKINKKRRCYKRLPGVTIDQDNVNIFTNKSASTPNIHLKNIIYERLSI